MNKRVRKNLNAVDDAIARARELIDVGAYNDAAAALDHAKDHANLAAAESRRAQERRENSNFVRNTR